LSSAATVYTTILAQPTAFAEEERVRAQMKNVKENGHANGVRANRTASWDNLGNSWVEEMHLNHCHSSSSPNSETFSQPAYVSRTGPQVGTRQSDALQSPPSNESFSSTRSVERERTVRQSYAEERRVVQPHEICTLGESSGGFETIRVQTDVCIPRTGDVQYQSVGTDLVATPMRTRHNTNTWEEVPRKPSPPPSRGAKTQETRQTPLPELVRAALEEEERVRKQMKNVMGNANGVRANQPTVEYRDRIVEVQKIVHVDRPVEVCLFRLSNKHMNNHRYACWIIIIVCTQIDEYIQMPNMVSMCSACTSV
jgi:hypothetical protein